MTSARILSLYSGVILPPLICLMQMEVCFALVPLACRNGMEYALYTTHAIALLLIAGTGVMSFVNWGLLEQHYARFVAMGGILSGSLFFLLTVAQTVDSLLMGACQ